MIDIHASLKQLATLRDERAQTAAALDEQIASLQQERDRLTKDINMDIKAVESEIREAVLGLGHTVKDDVLMAVWNKGRIKWDTKGLDGYAVANPEVGAFRSVGEPSVTIREVRR